MAAPFVYYAVYKPYGMLSQFTAEQAGDLTLADLDFGFAKDAYCAGRLDKDSEGLLVLTNDKTLQHKLADPRFEKEKTYYVQVEGLPTPEALSQLQKGVLISLKNGPYQTLPAEVLQIEEPALPPRTPPIRYRAQIPTSWLAITISEGKNRQVRKMTAAVNLPTLRLVRYRLGKLVLDNMNIGEVRMVKRNDIL